MKCPHCETDATYEAMEPFTFVPVLEKWEFDNPVQQADKVRCVCLECGKPVEVDVRARTIWKVKPDGES